MVNLCNVIPLNCQNNGQCAVNVSSNATYCQCDQCYEGDLCNLIVWKQTQFDTNYVFVIIYIIGVCFSVLNNSLALELFIRSKLIRRTNCGTYLIAYSILSLISSILLAAYGIQVYYPNALKNNPEQDQKFYCYVAKISYNTLVYLCIWLNACVAFERGLVIYFGGKMMANRWRSVVTIVVIFIIAVGSSAPMLWYNCDWDHVPGLQRARTFFSWFYVIVGLAIYILATLLVLITFARRISRYGTEDGSSIKTFLKLLKTHLFIFVPPIAYIVSYIPYAVLVSIKDSHHSYYQCGISTAEYIVKVLLETMTGTPVVITWLLFIYPSKVYMTEFYLNTWSGRSLLKILLLFKSF